MKNRKVKVNGAPPKNPPKPERVGMSKPAPMASNTLKKVKTRGTGAAIKGKMHMGC